MGTRKSCDGCSHGSNAQTNSIIQMKGKFSPADVQKNGHYLKTPNLALVRKKKVFMKVWNNGTEIG